MNEIRVPDELGEKINLFGQFCRHAAGQDFNELKQMVDAIEIREGATGTELTDVANLKLLLHQVTRLQQIIKRTGVPMTRPAPD